MFGERKSLRVYNLKVDMSAAAPIKSSNESKIIELSTKDVHTIQIVIQSKERSAFDIKISESSKDLIDLTDYSRVEQCKIVEYIIGNMYCNDSGQGNENGNPETLIDSIMKDQTPRKSAIVDAWNKFNDDLDADETNASEEKAICDIINSSKEVKDGESSKGKTVTTEEDKDNTSKPDSGQESIAIRKIIVCTQYYFPINSINLTELNLFVAGRSKKITFLMNTLNVRTLFAIQNRAKMLSMKAREKKVKGKNVKGKKMKDENCMSIVHF